MLYKKGPIDNFGNYRASGLMYHSYKLLSMLVLHRMRDADESRLAETQAGFRRERGCRDNVLLLRLLMDAVLRAGKEAVYHVYRLPRCLRHYQPPLPGRVIGSCRSTAEDPPHSEGHLHRGNRDGASALAERRDDVFGAISRQTRRHPGRHIQPAFSGCTTPLARALAVPPWVTSRRASSNTRTTSVCSTGRQLRHQNVSLLWRVVRVRPPRWRCRPPSRMACMCTSGNAYQCRRKWRLRPLTSHTAAPNARGLFQRHADWRCTELAGAARDSACLPTGPAR